MTKRKKYETIRRDGSCRPRPVEEVEWWLDRCRELIPFVTSKSRTWPELFEWAAENEESDSMLRHMMAWLEIQRYIAARHRGRTVTWHPTSLGRVHAYKSAANFAKT